MSLAGGDEDDDYDVSTDEYSTDEEYKKIIAGEESDSGDDEDDEVKEALRLFRKADRDGSGTISLQEFLESLQLNRDGVDDDDVDDVDSVEAEREEGRRQARLLSERLTALESKVDDIADKVNRLCEELAPAKTITWASETY